MVSVTLSPRAMQSTNYRLVPRLDRYKHSFDVALAENLHRHRRVDLGETDGGDQMSVIVDVVVVKFKNHITDPQVAA